MREKKKKELLIRIKKSSREQVRRKENRRERNRKPGRKGPEGKMMMMVVFDLLTF